MYGIGPFHYSFKNNQNKKIFSHEKLVINPREFVVITGPSGVGKSTLLQILKGLIPEFSSGTLEGEVVYKSKPLSGESFQKNLKEILFLFQNPFSQLIYPKAAEEFTFSMENFNYTRAQMDQKKKELSAVFELDSLWNKKTTDLSNGECQRLVLASLLAIDPEVLLLDEPTAFLDPKARAKFYSWLKKIKGTKTIIIVDHHINEVKDLADCFLMVSTEGEVSLLKELSSEKKTSSDAIIKYHQQKNQSPSLILSGDALSFHYSDQEKLLENIHFQARSGDVVFLRGENGKGKSTLFKLIAGIIKPDSGSVSFEKNLKKLSMKNYQKEIGFIFQNPESHFFYDTIEEELKTVKNREQLDRLSTHFLKGVDLKRSPFLLSEGEKRRLSILMTVFLDKTVLFYDEPTFGQDLDSIEQIIELILYLKEMGKIQFIISHDENFINTIADKVYHLEGRTLTEVTK